MTTSYKNTKIRIFAMYSYSIVIIVFTGFISSCIPTKNLKDGQVNYRDISPPGENTYKKLVAEYAKTLQDRTPIPLVVDSVTTIPNTWYPTVNFNMRKPNFVVLHHTAQDSCAQTLKTFSLEEKQVSSHYLICKDGDVYTLSNDYLRTWHAGSGQWGNIVDMNSSSIGIEIDNNGSEPFTENQINSLIILLENLQKKYNIPTANFIAHSDFAPKRKQDPSIYFPWEKLAGHNFGYWRDESLQIPPLDFNFIYALRMIGYDISDENAAIVAFKRHFVQNDISPFLTEYDKAVVYNIWRKFMRLETLK